MSVQMFTTDFLRTLLGEDTIGLINGFAANAYRRAPIVYDKVSEQKKTTLRLVELIVNKTLPYAGLISEGENRQYNKMSQVWKSDIYMQYYQSNYITTWQLLAHLANKAAMTKKILTSTAERALTLAMKKDRSWGDMMNAYDSSAQVYGDGQPIGSTSQLTGDGSTYSNLGSSAADINEFSMEAIVKVIRTWTDTGGKAIQPNPTCIVSGTDLEFDGARLLETEYTLGTNHNDVNVIKSGKYLPDGHYITPHIANDGSWHVITDVPDGLVTFTFQEPMFDMRPVPGTYDTEHTGLAAWVHAIGDKRGVFVSPRS